MYLGYTSLIYSSKRGHHDVVKVLLNHSANVNATDYNGKIVEIHDFFFMRTFMKANSTYLWSLKLYLKQYKNLIIKSVNKGTVID